jgi:hypothetical protein
VIQTPPLASLKPLPAETLLFRLVLQPALPVALQLVPSTAPVNLVWSTTGSQPPIEWSADWEEVCWLMAGRTGR